VYFAVACELLKHGQVGIFPSKFRYVLVTGEAEAGLPPYSHGYVLEIAR
jgi:hypothetical protein